MGTGHVLGSVCRVGGGCAIALLLARAAAADVTFNSQQRSISVATSSNGGALTADAQDFAPFVRTITLATTFPANGGPRPNTSAGRIDCQVDPNSLRAIGLLAGAGGLDDDTGMIEVGDSRAIVQVAFSISVATPYTLTAMPRPNLRPNDTFVLELRDQTRNDRLIDLNELDPPQQVNMTGTLLPGNYMMRYRVHATFDADPETRDFAFNLSLGCRADFDGSGALSVQDIFGFLAAWFAGDQRADMDGAGDITAQDIFGYLDAWFAGCA